MWIQSSSADRNWSQDSHIPNGLSAPLCNQIKSGTWEMGATQPEGLTGIAWCLWLFWEIKEKKCLALYANTYNKKSYLNYRIEPHNTEITYPWLLQISTVVTSQGWRQAIKCCSSICCGRTISSYFPRSILQNVTAPTRRMQSRRNHTPSRLTLAHLTMPTQLDEGF